jgi:acyl carrier protein
MTNPDIRKKVSAILARLAPLTPENAKPRALEFAAGGDTVPLDSVAVLQLVLALEEEFGVVVEDNDIGAENFADLQSLCRFVEVKLGLS